MFAILVMLATLVDDGHAVDFRDSVEYRVLLEARVFAGLAVGGGGDTPHTVHALRMVLENPRCRQMLDDLLERATLPGKLYALCGLYRVDREAYLAALGRLRERDDTVETFFGCFWGRRSVRELVDSPDPLESDIADGGLLRELAVSERATRDVDLDDIAEGLQSTRPGVRQASCERIASLGPSAAALSADVARLLRDPVPDVREEALRALHEVGPWAAAALPEIERVTATVAGRELDSAELLWLLQSLGSKSTPLVARFLDHPERDVRRLAAEVLLSFGDGARAAEAVVGRFLEDSDPLVRLRAAQITWQIRSDARAVLPTIVGLLDRADIEEDANHELFLPPAVDTLVEIARANDLGLRVIISMLESADEFQQEEAVELLRRVGPRASAAIPALEAYLERNRDDTPYLAIEAARAIRAIRGHSPALLPLLREELATGDPFLQSPAVRTLAELGPEARPVVPTIVELTGSKDRGVRLAAIVALRRIGDARDEVIKALTTALSAADERVLNEAVVTLAAFGDAARPAVALLRRVAENASVDESTRKRAGIVAERFEAR